MNYAEILSPLVWPLSFLLIVFVLIRQVRADVQPIVIGIVTGLAEGSRKNALFYAMAIAYATAASLQSLADVAREYHWIYLEALSKVLQPGIVAIIAYVNRPPSPSIADSNSQTPIPKTS